MVMLAAFKDLCLDARDATLVGRFWASALGLPWERQDNGDTVVRGGPLHTLWINQVPEEKVGKNRVHLDLRVPDVSALLDLGATQLADHGRWQVLADPEGNELCAFPADADEVQAPALPFAICVDSAQPVELAVWWHGVFGGHLGPGTSDDRPRWLYEGAGLDGVIFKAVPVDDPRTVKNRCHWDVVTDSVDALVAAGATVLRAPDDEISWTVLADPQGNELCAFPPG
ncbi:MAG: VOC family protein [Actinomycetota bacterium]